MIVKQIKYRCECVHECLKRIYKSLYKGMCKGCINECLNECMKEWMFSPKALTMYTFPDNVVKHFNYGPVI